VFASAIAHVPSVFLYSAGRPDLPAKLHMAELVVHVPLTLFLVSRFGVTGAAAAWTIRTTLDAVGLSLIAVRLGAWGLEPGDSRRWAATAAASAVLLVALAMGTIADVSVPLLPVIVLAIGTMGFAIIAWRAALADAERSALLGLIRSRPHD
jgi:hypothetical protein